MTIERLDPADPLALERFEQAFYTAFARAKGNRLVRRLWDWDDTRQRIRPRIPYTDQVIYVIWDENQDVDTATAVNLRLASYQAAILGFAPPPAELSGHSEILALFSRRDAQLVSLRTFLCQVSSLLLDQGVISTDATSTDRLLPVYRHIGGEPIDQRSIDGENRTLLRFQLRQVAELKELT